MNLLSVAFHIEAKALPKWQRFISENWPDLITKLAYFDRYIFSEVESPLIEEGSNYNLLIVFDHQAHKTLFLQQEMAKVVSEIQQHFNGDEVVIFHTSLHPIAHQL